MARYPLGGGVSIYLGFHLLVLGLLSYITGLPFLIPSLGPSLFLLGTLPDGEMNYPQRIIGGQYIGVIAGFVAFHLIVGNIDPTVSPALSLGVLRQVFSSFAAALLLTFGMYLGDVQHPPAYATTLIVSLGYLTSPRSVGVFMLAVLIMVGIHETIGKRGPIWSLPYEQDE
ncbi:HPP family protein [Halococcus salifodinae]|nr:HPP family protein [Halococcus salifodinae]